MLCYFMLIALKFDQLHSHLIHIDEWTGWRGYSRLMREAHDPHCEGTKRQWSFTRCHPPDLFPLLCSCGSAVQVCFVKPINLYNTEHLSVEIYRYTSVLYSFITCQVSWSHRDLTEPLLKGNMYESHHKNQSTKIINRLRINISIDMTMSTHCVAEISSEVNMLTE